ncbi:MAG: hypothetical protein V3V01_07510, partial [Acidimicrobiales bacterium]
QELTLTSTEDVLAALNNQSLLPHRAPPSLGTAETAKLRGAMARFSSTTNHGTRRQDVLAALEALEAKDFHEIARARTATRLTGGAVDGVAALASEVPTEAMAVALGSEQSDLAAIVADTRTIAAVIGRGAPASSESDRAVANLLGAFGLHPGGPVAAVSLLYQNHDATAALAAATMVANQLGSPRRCAISATYRVATADMTIAGRTVDNGQILSLDLERSGLEFGAGPHECPGAWLAAQIVSGICCAIVDNSYEFDPEEIGWGSDGRAETLIMRPGP